MLANRREFYKKYENRSKEFLLEWLFEILTIHFRMRMYMESLGWKSTEMIEKGRMYVE